jgi:hypothetical protein
MRPSLSAFGGVLCLLLSGCLSEHDCFEVEVKPEGRAFQRQLTCWHMGGKGAEEVMPCLPGVSREALRATSAGRAPTHVSLPRSAAPRVTWSGFAETTTSHRNL